MPSDDAPKTGMERAALIARVVRIVVFAAVAITLLRFMTTYKTMRVQSWNDQMEPSLAPGTKLLVHSGMLTAGRYSGGEMVAYAVESDGRVSVRFGRVAAVPGDEVKLSDEPGREVIVNGTPMAFTPVLVSPLEGEEAQPRPKIDTGEILVPGGTLYVVNDNLSSTLSDSRRLGPIYEQALAGKVVMSW